jgi:hypothetical protein
MNRFVFVRRSSLYLLPIIIVIPSLLFWLVMELYDSTSVNPAPFFSSFKILCSFGFMMSIVGMLLENSSMCPIDVYVRRADHVEFKNFVLVSFVKAAITLVGVVFFLSGLFLIPETPEGQKDFGYYLSLIVGGLFMIGLLSQLIIGVKNLYWNRGDFIHLSVNTVKWYDNDVKVIKEFRIGEIRFFTKKFEDTDKSSSLEEIHLHLLNGSIESISLKTMSLIPQGETIISELKEVIAEGESDSKLVN